MVLVHSNPGPGEQENNKKGVIQSVVAIVNDSFFFIAPPDENLGKSLRKPKKKTQEVLESIWCLEKILWQLGCNAL